jgi:hypothetical protein
MPSLRLAVSAVSAASLLLLAGCGKGKDADAPDLAANLVAYSNGKALPENSANHLPAYQRAVLSQVAGDYGGECNSVAGPVTRDGVHIGEQGAADSSMWHADLMGDGARLTLSRSLTAGEPASVLFSAAGAATPWQLTLGSGNGGHAMFGMGPSLAQCTRVAAVAALAARPLYAAVAPLFSGAASALNCVESDVTLGSTAVKADSAGVTVGKDRFAFDAGLRKETIAVEAQARTLQYGATYADGGSVSLSLDHLGKISAVFGKTATGPAFICGAPAS